MNQSALKNYAPQARLDFIQAVKDRAAFFGLTSESRVQIQETGDVVIIGGQAFPKVVAQQRKALLQRIAAEGFEAVMEAMAYTWFNRFVALRFMEVHGYLDHGYRVLSHPAGKPNPEILDHAERVTLPGLDPQQVIQLKLDGNRDAELYRLLLVAQCNALHQAIPFVFGKIADETELLLPDNLLHSNSVIRRLVNSIDESDWQEVEVLGWLYQFYISERKDQVMARKSAVPTEDIPAVTQLFTPHWIVRYLVENSLGRLWLLNRPTSRLKEHMPYYIEGEPETDFLKVAKPEEIRICDPACGSGHMLTYAFDLLTLIYEEEGYAPSEIPGLILRHNLHGLEICPRAAQLAELALVFKAREKSRRFFQPEYLVRPRIIELRDVRFEDGELPVEWLVARLKDQGVRGQGSGNRGQGETDLLHDLHLFTNAKNFGSLLQPKLSESQLSHLKQCATDLWPLSPDPLFSNVVREHVLRVFEQAEALTQRYHVVVANPPYMGGRQMNAGLKKYAEDHYPEAKADLFAMFIERSFSLALKKGFTGLVTMQSWMFLSSFEGLRTNLLATKTLLSMAHLGPRAFDTIGGEVVQATSFVAGNCLIPDRCGVFVRLTGGRSENEKASLFRGAIAGSEKGLLFRASAADFKKVTGSPIAYWMSKGTFQMLESADRLGSIAEARMGLATGDNQKFVRLWHECNRKNIGFSMETRKMAHESGLRWFPYCKGGTYRNWYGNNEYVVDWFDDGKTLQNTKHPSGERIWAHNFNLGWIFKDSITWSDITSGDLSVRFNPSGFLFDGSGTCAFFNSEAEKITALGLLNTPFVREFAKILNPTLHFQTGDFRSIPYKAALGTHNFKDNVRKLVDVARADWDNFETSWDFRAQPLLRPGLKGATLEASWRNWEAQSTAAIRRMQELETENNRLFIAAYGLDGELQPEVPEDQITLARADMRKDMAAFLSYAIGCMMGRYSLDKPGLVYADSGSIGFDPSQYHTFTADADGILPVTELAWFLDDATERFIEFLTETFAPVTLEANLKFIADALVPTKDETPRDTIRRYLAAGFYKDHLQTYKRRPIYWLFSSGKQRAFQCLVYLHRYNEGTLARMRTEYVIPLQGKISHRIDQLAGDITAATSTSHRKKLEKERESLVKQATELAAFDEKLRHYADQRIALDLDDGVKVNYAKFGDLLAEVKAVTGGSEE